MHINIKGGYYDDSKQRKTRPQPPHPPYDRIQIRAADPRSVLPPHNHPFMSEYVCRTPKKERSALCIEERIDHLH